MALRWERLKNRFESHKKCVDDGKVTLIIEANNVINNILIVKNILENLGVNYSVIGREELHRGSMVDKDLVIAVGGDGTILNTASFMDDSIPVLGVNSDPTKLEEKGVTNLKDERRSRGALCGTTANTGNNKSTSLISIQEKNKFSNKHINYCSSIRYTKNNLWRREVRRENTNKVSNSQYIHRDAHAACAE